MVIKSCLLAALIPQRFRSTTIQRPLMLLIGVIVGSMAGELVWLIKLLRELFIPGIPYAFIIFCLRLAWAFLIIQYLALGLFLESLTAKKFSLTRIQKVLVGLSSTVILYFMYLAFFNDALIDESERILALASTSSISPFLEITIMRHTVLYLLPLLIVPSFFSTMRKLRSNELPKILNHQLSVIIKYLMAPYLLAELLIATHFEFRSLKLYTYAVVGISAILITYIVYYCIRRVMGMRFLNSSGHVESKHTFNFIDDFKLVLEQLSFATTIQELGQITASFFKDSCDIPIRKVTLYIRATSLTKEHISAHHQASDALVEEYFSSHGQEICHYIQDAKILIYDEIAFSNFYQEEARRTNVLEFLERINADIFLPIYEKERMIAYIIVEAHARPTQLYSNVERDEMLVFASYLCNIINLLQNRNLEALMFQQHELKEELYRKHQEINQYRDSIRSFLKNSKHKEIGIIFYKQRRFILANQSAKELITINPNTQEGHPLARALKTVARQVEEYKSPQTLLAKDTDGTRLVVSGVPNLEQNNVILTVSYPDIVDIMSKQISLLKDPTTWDYLLYLETTKPGQLINQLIPGSSETFLNFKISLLQTALSQKATLLEVEREDLMPTVELLHHISMREILHVIKLQGPCTTNEIGMKFFGINSLYGTPSDNKPLLEKLNTTGTLFIQNIEYLDLETQEHLAEVIKYGLYRPLKSDQHYASSVRIICSTEHNLFRMTQEGNFSEALCNELRKTVITIPSLLTIPEHELRELTTGFTEQAIHSHDFKNLLDLTDKDQSRIIASRPVSLHELKTKVQQLLVQKSKKNNIDQEIQLDPGFDAADAELIQAARLGKHALKDHKLMLKLWNKFKSQNKIATFLGVNRSSVNRRCKEYNLQ